MKKTLVSALTTALVVGAASTTFAAANPFADVPADHWAYDAVSQLADAGIVDGYLDGAFKGDQGMSRYEMAQIVAKAMTKSDKADAANKAMIDKLAAEFGDELANLGVKVEALEKKVDNVKWEGLIRYDWTRLNGEVNGPKYNEDNHRNQDGSKILLRLEPTFSINENWEAHARMDYELDNTNEVQGSTTATLDRIWAEGNYGKANIKFGRLPEYSDSSHGLVFDDKVTGASVAYAPTASWKVKATVGQLASDKIFGVDDNHDSKAKSPRYGALEVTYNNGKWDAGVGYRQYATAGIGSQTTIAGQTLPNGVFFTDKDKIQVVDLGVGYKFDKNVKLTGDYAFGTSYSDGTYADQIGAAKNAYKINVSYKGAKHEDPHSWGAYIEYRQHAPFTTVYAAGDNKNSVFGYKSLRGFEIGANYTFAKNMMGTVKYFIGKDTLLNDKDKVHGIFTRLELKF